jgi:hypothetical protein
MPLSSCTPISARRLDERVDDRIGVHTVPVGENPDQTAAGASSQIEQPLRSEPVDHPMSLSDFRLEAGEEET